MYSIICVLILIQGNDAAFSTEPCSIHNRGQQQSMLLLVKEAEAPPTSSFFHKHREDHPAIRKRGRIRAITRGGALFSADPRRDSEVSTKPASSQYFLLSTFSIWRSIVIKAIILFAIQITMRSYLPGVDSSITLHHESCHNPSWFVWIRAISIPLLSSACCALQLFLNAFFAGAGCAGFNQKLGPLRPYFMSILLFTTIQTFSKRKIVQLSLAWGVALMPELVHVMNQRMAKVNSKNRESTLPVNKPSVYAQTAVIEFNIKDMGCVACINKIDGILQTSERNVIEAKSWLNNDGLKGGTARVEVEIENLDFLDRKVEEMIGLVKGAGFQCEMSNVEVRKNK